MWRLESGGDRGLGIEERVGMETGEGGRGGRRGLLSFDSQAECEKISHQEGDIQATDSNQIIAICLKRQYHIDKVDTLNRDSTVS